MNSPSQRSAPTKEELSFKNSYAESWFGELTDIALTNDLEGYWQAEEAAATASIPALNNTSQPPAFQRIYQAFLGARLALGATFLIVILVASTMGVQASGWLWVISGLYTASAFILWLRPEWFGSKHSSRMKPLNGWRWLATIGTDLICFSFLHVASPGTNLNFIALMVLPVLMAGVLTSRLFAIATASSISLLLLGVSWWGVMQGGEAAMLMTQAGLAGSGFIVISILAGELANRLAREELTAIDSIELARQQAELSQLVIEEMQDGVLVVDRKGLVRSANPAARRLIAPVGICRPAPFQLHSHPAWEPLVSTVDRAFIDDRWPSMGRDVKLKFNHQSSRTLRVKVRFMRGTSADSLREGAVVSEDNSEEFCVLLIEDLRTVQMRIRQEKLAAMGRVSAGIAHEIRNPLSAIAQANALMAEDNITPEQAKLTVMIGENVQRLKRIVDDVMELAPGANPHPSILDMCRVAPAICTEWAQASQVSLGPQSLLQFEIQAQSLGAFFDADHLRRILVNLLDNAKRHASQKPGSVLVRLQALEENKLLFSVSNDGPLVTPDVERYLFEPFFSTRSRGTGLGLYICRELCERYGASIDYRQLPVGEPRRNEFYVLMRRKPMDTSGMLF